MSAAQEQTRPPLYGDRRRWGLVQTDSLAFLSLLPDACVSAVITDPPYGIAFRGQQWDGGYLTEPEGFQAFSSTWAREVRRILKPGGYAAIFGAPRTVHRLVAGIEDAGLEIRDQLLWIYATGVPKSRRMPGGLGTALKPSYEPILLVRRPLDPVASTVNDNVSLHGTGGLGIDAARIARPEGEAGREGFWPPNLALGHDPDCTALSCVPRCAVPLIDQLTEGQRSPSAPAFSRLFYATKASQAEREAGCEQLVATPSEIFTHGYRPARTNHHPTVKPLSLMRWLIRLIVPPGGVVLDPFAGSGSTGCAAVLEDRQFVGLERERAYVDIARARLAYRTALPRDPQASG